MRIVFFDGPFYLHSNTAALSRFKNSSGTPTGGAYGFLRSMKSVINGVKKATKEEVYPVVLWDSHPSARKAMNSDYKADRVKSDSQKSAYRIQKDMVFDALSGLGVPLIHAPQLEADDLAAFYSKIFAGCFLASIDRDWLLLVSDTTSVWLHGKDKKIVTPKNFLKVAKVLSPKHLLIHKCIFGDSDNIPAIDLLDVSGLSRTGIEGALSGSANASPETFTKIATLTTREDYQRNLELIHLPNESFRNYFDSRSVSHGTGMFEDAIRVFEIMEAKSLVEDDFWKELSTLLKNSREEFSL